MVGRTKGSVKTDINNGFIRKSKSDFDTEEEYNQYKKKLIRYKNALHYEKNKEDLRQRAKHRYEVLDEEQRREYIAKLSERIMYKYNTDSEFRERHKYYDKLGKNKRREARLLENEAM